MPGICPIRVFVGRFPKPWRPMLPCLLKARAPMMRTCDRRLSAHRPVQPAHLPPNPIHRTSICFDRYALLTSMLEWQMPHARRLRDPSIECMLVQHLWMGGHTIFANTLLPISTKLEQSGITARTMHRYNDVVINENRQSIRYCRATARRRETTACSTFDRRELCPSQTTDQRPRERLSLPHDIQPPAVAE